MFKGHLAGRSPCSDRLFFQEDTHGHSSLTARLFSTPGGGAADAQRFHGASPAVNFTSGAR